MSAIAPIVLPDRRAVEAETLDFVRRAEELVVTDEESYRYLTDALKECKSRIGKIEEMCDPSVRAAKAAHQAACDLRNELRAPYLTIEQILKNKGAGWLMKVEQARRAEEQRLREIARKQEEERRLAEAVMLEDEGAREEAEAVLDAPILAPVVSLPKPARVEGISQRKQYTGDVTDAAAFLGWLIQHPDRINEVIGWKAQGLNNLAKSTAGSVEIPGFAVNVVTTIASGRA